MKVRLVLVALAAAVVVSGCSDDAPAPAPEATSSAAPVPAYDASLEPAAAVLALVPTSVRTLTVTDFDQVRAELGIDGLSDASPASDEAAFWQRATAERPLLTNGMLRSVEGRLARYGFGPLDVDWEAHLYDGSGAASGYVLAFREGTDMAQVQQAVAAGVGPLAGATVDAANRLVTSGTTADPTQSWAADRSVEALVGLPANATYVAQGCVAGEPTGDSRLTELSAYSVQFEGSLVTARLGTGRHDLFARMRLGQGDATFDQAYDGGVADPETGRIGYIMADPAQAAQLALDHDLPFAACS